MFCKKSLVLRLVSRVVIVSLFVTYNAVFTPITFSQVTTIDSLKQMLEKETNDSNKVDILTEIAGSIGYTDVKEGIIYGQRALHLAKEIGYPFGIANAYNAIGIALNMEGKFEESNEALFKSRHHFAAINDSSGVATNYINIAINYNSLAIDSLAIHYNMEALRIYESLGDSSGIGTILGNVAIIYERHNHLEKALEYYNRAIDIQKKAKDFQGLGYTYNNISTFYTEQKDYKKSSEYLDLALEYAEKVNDQYLVSIAYLNKSDNDMQLGKLTESRKNLEICFKIIKEIDSEELLPTYYASLAEILLKEKKYGPAEDEIKKSIDLGKRFGNKEEIKESYEILIQILEKRNKYEQAFEAQKLFVAYQDSIRNESQMKKITEIKYRYETDKKEQHNQLLKSENAHKQEIIIWQYVLGALSVFSLIITLIFIRSLKRNYKQIKTLYDEVNIKNVELASAIEEINTLRGFIPICANCKKIRNDQGYWEMLETYITKHSEAVLTHGICPDCQEELYGDYMRNLRDKNENNNKN